MTAKKVMSDRKKRELAMRELVGAKLYDENKLRFERADAAQEAALFVRQMREAASLSQHDLAEALDVTQARISEIERGGVPEGISYALLRSVAKACGYDEWPPSPLQGVVNQPEFYEIVGDELEIVAPSQSVSHSGRRGAAPDFEIVELVEDEEKAGRAHAQYHAKIRLNPKLRGASVLGVRTIRRGVAHNILTHYASTKHEPEKG